MITFLSKSYIILSVSALLLILVSGIYLNITKFSIVKIYPFVMLILGLGYMYVFPAMSAPDEIAHFISAYKISNKMLGNRQPLKTDM